MKQFILFLFLSIALFLNAQTFETSKSLYRLSKYDHQKIWWNFSDNTITFKHLDGKNICILHYYNYPSEQIFTILNTEKKKRKTVYTVDSEIYFGKIIFKRYTIKVKLYDKNKNEIYKDFYYN